MAQDQSIDERIARAILDNKDHLAEIVAAGKGQSYNMEKIGPQDELHWWNWADQSIDADAELAAGAMPIDVAMRKYPMRLRLVRSGGRVKLKDQIDYAKKMAERSAHLYGQIEPLAAPGEDEMIYG